MALFGAGLQFLQLIPVVLRLINDRIRRKIINNDNFINDLTAFQNLSNQWMNFTCLLVQWLRIRRDRKKLLNNPHTLITLLAGYRYVLVRKVIVNCL